MHIFKCFPQVSKETTDLLIEVTSTLNLDTCKKAMDELLQGLLEMGVGNNPEATGSGAATADGLLLQDQRLVVEQVGNLLVLDWWQQDCQWGRRYQCSKLLPVRLPEADNFRGGLGTFLKIFFNFMFMICDSRQED